MEFEDTLVTLNELLGQLPSEVIISIQFLAHFVVKASSMFCKLAPLLHVLGANTRPKVIDLCVVILVVDNRGDRIHRNQIALSLVLAWQKTAPSTVE